MRHRWLIRFHELVQNWRFILPEEFLALFLALFIFIAPATANTRLTERSLLIRSSEPGVVTDYTVAFRYVTPAAIGSVDLLFCESPIPYDLCVVPAGLNVSGATLSSQSGETGFSISTQTPNHIVLSRPASMITATDLSSYTLSGVTNPTSSAAAFSIRLRTHTSTNATGPQIDFGSVRSQVTTGVELATQVPPMLIFCVAEEVANDCTGTNDNYYKDMGELTDDQTLVARSQMAVGTNASGGFAITVNGSPPAAGTSVINTPTTPTVSQPGTDQFGINLVQNTLPAIGSDPEGTWLNAQPTNDYGQQDRYKYVPGDVVASSPDVSLMKKFTVSYIFNASPSLKAGVYTTTITYVASGRF